MTIPIVEVQYRADSTFTEYQMGLVNQETGKVFKMDMWVFLTKEYMLKGIAENEQEAAWEFMKYLTTLEVQAKWHLDTGYFAINPKAYDEENVKAKWAEFLSKSDR